MREGSADDALHCRVGQVALQARYREFPREVLEKRVAHAPIALRVLEIDRIHFVGHRRRTDLSFLRLLGYPAVGNVAPHVLRKVDEYGIRAAQTIEELGIGVVGLDLCRYLVELELYLVPIAQSRDKSARERGPVTLRRSREMCAVVDRKSV